MVVGALAATVLIVFAARAKPQHRVEVAESGDAGHRVLVVAVAEATAASAERIAALAGSPNDVRVLVPVPSHRLDRWLSAEDDARAEAERRLSIRPVPCRGQSPGERLGRRPGSGTGTRG
jgi:hypothetical protein